MAQLAAEFWEECDFCGDTAAGSPGSVVEAVEEALLTAVSMDMAWVRVASSLLVDCGAARDRNTSLKGWIRDKKNRIQ